MLEEVVRRLGIIMHINPYQMWKEQSPRQIFELVNTYKDMNKEAEEGGDGEGKGKKNYTVKSKGVKIPDWYTVPEGATVYHADDVFQGDL